MYVYVYDVYVCVYLFIFIILLHTTGAPDSDYEFWSPFDSDSEEEGPDAKKCVLGQHRVYRRRKR